MSCDENHDARAKDRARRSLPVVGQGADKAELSAPRAYWRSIEERDRPPLSSAANEFPAGSDQLDGVSRRER